MSHLYKRGVANIRGHVLKCMNLLRILANVTGTYGVSGLEYQIGKGDSPVNGGVYSK